jgi:hypothetical protein
VPTCLAFTHPARWHSGASPVVGDPFTGLADGLQQLGICFPSWQASPPLISCLQHLSLACLQTKEIRASKVSALFLRLARLPHFQGLYAEQCALAPCHTWPLGCCLRLHPVVFIRFLSWSSFVPCQTLGPKTPSVKIAPHHFSV